MMAPAEPNPVRVLIIDDDPVFRQILTKTFGRIAGVELVGSAANLTIAREKLTHHPVDLVTLDVVLRDESGLDLLPWIQQHHPQLVTVLLTSGTVREACQGVDALLLGASTLILKPSGPDAPQKLQDELWRVVEGSRKRRAPATPAAKPGTFDPRVPQAREVIAVGSSTGGPPVVLRLLKDLPASFHVPILLTQHMPALHIPYFAEHLARDSGRDVRLAHHGDAVEAGGVYVACERKHMKVGRLAGQLVVLQDDGPEEHYCKPAVDPLFRSVAEVCGSAAVGVVLTGMGSDGAQGAVALRQRGAPVIIQDEKTSVVWGMPGAVAAVGAASEIVALEGLGPSILNWTSSWKSAH